MKQLSVIALLLFSITLVAQDEKPTQRGNLMVGGSAHFSYGSQLNESTSGSLSTSLSPSVGFFLADGFALGFSPSFSLTTELVDNDYTNLSTGLGVFLVNYFKFGLFIKGKIGYSLSHYSIGSGYYATANTNHGVYFIPEIGYAFFLGPNVALELSLQDRVTMHFDDIELFSRTYISAGFQIFL